ncbi:LOW QUALITY PROTEIN: Androglobin [Phytophthora megakarya]|uniref:Androglobin n=1 Tax=Phytophthora megakarya TaxID=4795 RepID=A0A225W506_9STRA|nr:LOW QUALITY PROTEIN: Androglobin [Phytophthora megakarya]
MTPYEVMWGRRPDLHHLRRFGVRSQQNQSITYNFDPNGKIGLLLGYQEGRHGCKLYYPNLRTVGYALDIRCNKDIVFKDCYKAECRDAIGDLSYMNPEDSTV